MAPVLTVLKIKVPAPERVTASSVVIETMPESPCPLVLLSKKAPSFKERYPA